MAERPACPAEAALDLIVGRWKLMVIYWLLQGEQRFNRLQRNLGAITHRTLAKTLKDMEADGLILRTDHAEVPPRVDYRLTELGRSLETVLRAMDEWASTHMASQRSSR